MKSNFLADKSEFVDWIGRTQVSLYNVTGNSFMLGDPEIDFKVEISEAGEFTVSMFQRNLYKGVYFQSDRWSDTEKYLTFLFGNDIRRRAIPKMPSIGLRSKETQVNPSFSLTSEGGLARLRWNDTEGARSAAFRSKSDAIEFSIYQRLSAAELRASFDDPMGRPLLVGAPGESGAISPEDLYVSDGRPTLSVQRPDIHWGWDENGVPIASQDEWNARYVKPSTRADGVGEMRWPGNDGSVNGTRVMYFSVEALLEDYPQFRNLDRVGRDTGCVLAVEGTPFEQRGLTPGHRNFDYDTYKLTGYCPENVRPEVSIIAPANGYPGGGWQIRFMDMDRSVWVSVADLVNPKKYGVLE